MAALAEDSLSQPRRGQRLRSVVLVLLGLVAVSALGYGLKSLLGQPAPVKRQVAKVSLLPDTPPPPPPPPKEEKRPEPPKAEQRPQPQEPKPQPQEAPKPANEPLKMEGAAGDGPSPFAAGSVSKDYAGGAPATGTAASAAAPAAPAPSPADRAQERLYASSARQQLRDAIERTLEPEAAQATATFSLWVERDGAIGRVELQPTGNAEVDAQLDRAIADTRRELRLAPPPAQMQQPMRFRLTLRPQG